jgi:hypothetical protein
MIDAVKAENGGMNPQMTSQERRDRCRFCYTLRLRRTAEEAKRIGYEHFSTTMLLSKHQDHGTIRRIGSELGEELGIDFLYKDLRGRWKDSIRISRGYHMYRQNYCGCIFSEQERYHGPDGKNEISG